MPWSSRMPSANSRSTARLGESIPASEQAASIAESGTGTLTENKQATESADFSVDVKALA